MSVASKGRKFDTGMNNWAEAYAQHGAALARLFTEGEDIKKLGLATLTRLGLPQWKNVAGPLTDFLANPQACLARATELGSNQYHVSLTSNIEGKKRVRKFPLTANEVAAFIHERIAPTEENKFLLILKEVAPNIYGGNIIINENGSILMEVAPGDHLELVSGRVTPTVFGLRNEFTKALGIYNDNHGTKPLEDKNLEQTLLRTINLIPKDRFDEDGKPDFHAGYYEFVLVEDKKKGGLRPVFLDYREGKVYRTQL